MSAEAAELIRAPARHPVLRGRAHWEPLSASLIGDSGARDYLVEHRAREVECGDLFSGADRDGPG